MVTMKIPTTITMALLMMMMTGDFGRNSNSSFAIKKNINIYIEKIYVIMLKRKNYEDGVY